MSFKSFMFPSHFSKASVWAPMVASAMLMGSATYSLMKENRSVAGLQFSLAGLLAFAAQGNRTLAGRKEEIVAAIRNAEHRGGGAFMFKQGNETHVFIMMPDYHPQNDPNVIDVEATVIPDTSPAPQRK